MLNQGPEPLNVSWIHPVFLKKFLPTLYIQNFMIVSPGSISIWNTSSQNIIGITDLQKPLLTVCTDILDSASQFVYWPTGALGLTWTNAALTLDKDEKFSKKLPKLILAHFLHNLWIIRQLMVT